MKRLLLTAPEYHECDSCGINSHYAAADERAGLFFVERTLFKSEPVPTEWELCDLCDIDFRAWHHRREPEIWTFRGVPIWANDPGFFGFEEMPMICVTDASNQDWENGIQEERETWLFCRDRYEWKYAWEAARLIVRNGYNRFEVSEHGTRLLDLLPAYKAPWAHTLTIHTTVLLECDSGPFMGFCAVCDRYDLLKEPCAVCEDCWRPEVHSLDQEAGK